MAFDILRSIILPLLLLAAIVAVGFYLYRFREGFAVSDSTPLQLALGKQTLSAAAVTATAAATANVNGLLGYIGSFAANLANSVRATNIQTRLTLLTGDLQNAVTAITAANTNKGSEDPKAISASTTAFNTSTSANTAFTTTNTALNALIATYNSAASTSSDISTAMAAVTTAVSGLVSAMQTLTTAVVLSNGAAANAVSSAATAEVQTATAKSVVAQ